MPFIGEARILSPAEFNNITDDEGLSLTKKGDIIASKGTLSDGLYSVWAYFCPNQAREQNQVILKQVVSQLFDPSQDRLNNSLSAVEGSRLTGAKVKFLKETLKTRLERQNKCADQDVAEALYNNQFLPLHPASKDDNEQTYLALGEATYQFKKQLTPAARESFNTALKNFLGQKLQISKKTLEAFLKAYKDLLTNESVKKAIIVNQFKNLSKEIADVGYDQSKFFTLLAKLSDQKIPIVSNGKKMTLLPEERDFFINSLLNNFTVKDDVKDKKGRVTTGNSDAYQLVKDVGKFLGERKIENLSSITNPSKDDQATLKRLATTARKILDQDDARKTTVRSFSAQIKKEVEEYQRYEKAERAAGRTPLPMKHREAESGPNSDPIKQPLLSHDAQTLLEGIIQQCTPNQDPVALQPMTSSLDLA